MRTLFIPRDHTLFADFALWGIRAAAGIGFALHGWMKMQDPFGWMGPGAFAPGPFQALAAISEFGGGLGWILGLLTPVASLAIGSTMVVALWTHIVMRGDPYVSMTGGPAYELALVYLCLAVLLIAFGPGRFSVDNKLFRRR